MSSSQDSVRFLAGSECCTRPCERNRVLLGLVVPSFCVQFNLLYFFRSLVPLVGGYLVVVDGRKEPYNMLVIFDMYGSVRFMGARSYTIIYAEDIAGTSANTT